MIVAGFSCKKTIGESSEWRETSFQQQYESDKVKLWQQKKRDISLFFLEDSEQACKQIHEENHL